MKKKNTFLRVGLVLTALVVGFIVLGLFWTPYSPNAMDFSRLLPPSAAHPMGTDKFGRDILSRVMVGAGDTLLIALGTVAAELNLSELKLIRLFKLHLGVTPKAYLIALRMRRAESLLAGSVRPVNEIALSCGYGSARCFSREFRKKHGISPLEFRRRSLTNPVRSDLLNDDE